MSDTPSNVYVPDTFADAETSVIAAGAAPVKVSVAADGGQTIFDVCAAETEMANGRDVSISERSAVVYRPLGYESRASLCEFDQLPPSSQAPEATSGRHQ